MGHPHCKLVENVKVRMESFSMHTQVWITTWHMDLWKRKFSCLNCNWSQRPGTNHVQCGRDLYVSVTTFLWYFCNYYTISIVYLFFAIAQYAQNNQILHCTMPVWVCLMIMMMMTMMNLIWCNVHNSPSEPFCQSDPLRNPSHPLQLTPRIRISRNFVFVFVYICVFVYLYECFCICVYTYIIPPTHYNSRPGTGTRHPKLKPFVQSHASPLILFLWFLFALSLSSSKSSLFSI